jgi:lipopolysaccharide/colanic/teichoic acid biosynthesis glycosyltransferase
VGDDRGSGRSGEFELAATGERTGEWYYRVKRCLDIVLGGALLVVASPIMALIALLIIVDSPGPVFFIQERVGVRRRGGRGAARWEVRPFRLYKFRSMVHNADQSLHKAHVEAFVQGQAPPPGPARAGFKLTDDPRVTRIGSILRRTSLDELPQLLNVLKGEMSLVGPRPVPAYEVAHYQPWHYERLAAVPGITGLWQVNGRCALPFDDMIRLDLEYVQRRSLAMDLKILLMTVPAVLSGRGAE